MYYWLFFFLLNILKRKRARGVTKAVVDVLITLNDYNHTLETNKSLVREVVSIRSFSQQIFTYKQDQIASTSCYDKVEMSDNINCEPYGYT